MMIIISMNHFGTASIAQSVLSVHYRFRTYNRHNPCDRLLAQNRTPSLTAAALSIPVPVLTATRDRQRPLLLIYDPHTEETDRLDKEKQARRQCPARVGLKDEPTDDDVGANRRIHLFRRKAVLYPPSKNCLLIFSQTYTSPSEASLPCGYTCAFIFLVCLTSTIATHA